MTEDGIWKEEPMRMEIKSRPSNDQRKKKETEKRSKESEKASSTIRLGWHAHVVERRITTGRMHPHRREDLHGCPVKC